MADRIETAVITGACRRQSCTLPPCSLIIHTSLVIVKGFFNIFSTKRENLRTYASFSFAASVLAGSMEMVAVLRILPVERNSVFCAGDEV